MRSPPPGTIAILVALNLSCTPAVGHAPAATDTGPADSGGEPLTAACVDYLACAALATPEEVASIEERLGEGGSCWSSTTETSAQCRRECLDGLEDLQETHGADCAGEDTGGRDTDAGDTDDGDTDDDDIGHESSPNTAYCPMGQSAWDLEFVYGWDSCGQSYTYPNPRRADLTCYRDWFDLLVDDMTPEMGCWWDGTTFACMVIYGSNVIMQDGEVAPEGGGVTGTFDFDYGHCVSWGTYTARAATE